MDQTQQNQGGVPAPQNNAKPPANIMSYISYISFLCLIPILAKETDQTVKFHAKQGLVLFIGEVITWIITAAAPGVGWLFGPILSILWLVLSIIGILNVYRVETKPLPLIGQFAEKINI